VVADDIQSPTREIMLGTNRTSVPAVDAEKHRFRKKKQHSQLPLHQHAQYLESSEDTEEHSQTEKKNPKNKKFSVSSVIDP